MTYLLDTNVVSFFLQEHRKEELAEAAKLIPMAIVGEVRDELAADTNRGGPAFNKWLASSNIAVKELLVGSPAANTLASSPLALPQRRIWENGQALPCL